MIPPKTFADLIRQCRGKVVFVDKMFLYAWAQRLAHEDAGAPASGKRMDNDTYLVALLEGLRDQDIRLVTSENVMAALLGVFGHRPLMTREPEEPVDERAAKKLGRDAIRRRADSFDQKLAAKAQAMGEDVSPVGMALALRSMRNSLSSGNLYGHLRVVTLGTPEITNEELALVHVAAYGNKICCKSLRELHGGPCNLRYPAGRDMKTGRRCSPQHYEDAIVAVTARKSDVAVAAPLPQIQFEGQFVRHNRSGKIYSVVVQDGSLAWREVTGGWPLGIWPRVLLTQDRRLATLAPEAIQNLTMVLVDPPPLISPTPHSVN